MAVAKRCPFCLKKLRKDGTCANQQCPRYVPESTEDKTADKDKK